jgi:hypothetical protein
MKPQPHRPIRFTPFQRYVIALFGVCVIASGIAALLAAEHYFHARPVRYFGWVFAAIALAVGWMLVSMALRLGKPR